MLVFPGIAVPEECACQQERAARIIASVFESGNPNDSPFKGTKNSRLVFLKDIIAEKQKISITHEHSLVSDEETPDKEPTRVTGYVQFADWMAKLQAPDKHGFQRGIDVRTLGECRKNCCEFPIIYGIQHNTLYLTKVCFGTGKTGPYLKSVVLLDGD
jgi:hypothetical protein